MKPARGNTATVGFKFETEAKIPAFGSFFFLRINSPANFNLLRTKVDDGSLDPSGFQQPMTPGTVRANSPELNLRMTSGHSLEFLYNFFGGVTKNVISGGFEYVFAGDSAGPDSAFSVFVDMDPVERYIRHTFKVSDIEVPISGSDPLVAKFTGNFMTGQSYDEASNFSGTGTYQQPSIKGPIKFRGLGDIYIKVTDVAPLKYQAELSTIAPIYPGTVETPVEIDGVTDRGVFQNVQGDIRLPGLFTATTGTTVTADVAGLVDLNTKKFLLGGDKVGMSMQIGATVHTLASVTDSDTFEITPAHAGASGIPVHMLNRDFGFFGENKDPIEVVFAGDATDFADIDLDDEWRFREVIQARTPTFTGYDNFTPAHAVHYFREVGSNVWTRFDGVSSTLKGSWPLEPEEGHGSRYLTALDRTGNLVASLDPFDAVYRAKNKAFVDWAESHEDIEAEVRILGKQLGDGTFREGHIISLPNGGVTNADRPIAGPGRITLTTQTVGTTNVAGDSPLTWKVYTERDWTAPVFI